MPQLVQTKRGKWSPAGTFDSTGEPQLLQKFKGRPHLEKVWCPERESNPHGVTTTGF
jgi:hypothetical protein